MQTITIQNKLQKQLSPNPLIGTLNPLEIPNVRLGSLKAKYGHRANSQAKPIKIDNIRRIDYPSRQILKDYCDYAANPNEHNTQSII